MRLAGVIFVRVTGVGATCAYEADRCVGSSGGPRKLAFLSFFACVGTSALFRHSLSQPNWLTPVMTSTARLKQEIRYDISWQRNADGSTTENYGGGRGFTTILISRIEISINLPPYIVHHERNLHDGFGDLSFMAKFRILAGNRENGDYVLDCVSRRQRTQFWIVQEWFSSPGDYANDRGR